MLDYLRNHVVLFQKQWFNVSETTLYHSRDRVVLFQRLCCTVWFKHILFQINSIRQCYCYTVSETMLYCSRDHVVLFQRPCCTVSETMLRLYCDKVGIEYQSSMVNWEETPKDLGVFQEWMPWFEGVLTSKSFQPSATKPKSPQVMSTLWCFLVVTKSYFENLSSKIFDINFRFCNENYHLMLHKSNILYSPVTDIIFSYSRVSAIK